MIVPSGGDGLRRAYLDALRGVAIVLMVVNHTGRWWMDGSMRWERYWLIYATMLLAAPIFLFLVGYCLALSVHRSAEVEGRSAWDLLRRYSGRGARIVVAGWALNLLVLQDPVFNGGVLQTIGLTVILLAPAGAFLRTVEARWLTLAAAVAIYGSFALAHPGLVRWSAEHAAVARTALFDFPLWPWISIAMVGLVLGRMEMDRKDDAARSRYYRALGVIGLVLVAGILAWELTAGTSPAAGFRRDFSLNNHWTPRPLTAVWIAGAVLVSLTAAWWLMEARGLRARWLVVFGQTAFMIYFVHQVIVYTIVTHWLGILMNDWALYTIANVVLLAVLLALARAWLAVRTPLKDAARARVATLLRLKRSPAPPPARTAA